jgi:nitrous oxide reductase accessory protein NosL
MTPAKMCRYCGKRLEPHPGEKPARFKRRHHCSRQCSAFSWQRHKFAALKFPIEEWNDAEEVR